MIQNVVMIFIFYNYVQKKLNHFHLFCLKSTQMLSSLYTRIHTPMSLYACTFCASPNHVLRQCTDRRLERFEVLCRAKKADYIDNDMRGMPVHYTNINTDTQERVRHMLRAQRMFTSWLRNYHDAGTEEDRKVMRCFAQQKCLTSAFTTMRYMDIMIYQIMMYFFELPMAYRPIQTEEREGEGGGEGDGFLSFATGVAKPWLVVEKEEEHTTEDCAVCLTAPTDTHFGCQHAFCQGCVGHLLEIAHRDGKSAHCPLCRDSVTSVTTTTSPQNLAAWSHLCRYTRVLPA